MQKLSISVTAFLAALTLNFFASAAPNAPVAATVIDEGSAKIEEGAPAMWRVADEDTEIILFGTFHILPDNVAWRTTTFDDAMARTETTVTEVDTDNPEALAKLAGLMQELGQNPPGVTLSDTLGPERFAQLSNVAEGYGIPPSMLETARPWFGFLQLSLAGLVKEGFDPANGVETVVKGQATQEEDAFAYLESVEFQIRALASLDGPEMLANFDISMEQLKDLKAYSQKMVEVWRTGDLAGIEETIIAPMRDDAPTSYNTLIVERNKNWAVQLIDWLNNGGTEEGDYFVAVGAGHLVGPESVINMMREKGWTVERIQ